MTTLFSDPFNRTSSTVDATNWTENPGANWAVDGANAVCDVITAAFGSLITTTSAHAAVANCRVTCKRTSASFDGGPVARADSAGNNLYLLDVYGSNNVDIIRRVAGSDTTVATRNTSHTTGDVFAMEISGTGATVTIKVFKNGVQMGADVTDTSGSRIVSAGQCGIACYGTGSNITFDDFLVEDLAGGGGGGGMLRPADGMTGGFRSMSGGMSG